MADDPSRPGGAPSGGMTGSLSKKMMGLPTWTWVALAAAAGVVTLVWVQSRRGKAAGADTDTTSYTSQEPLDTDQYESLLGLLRDIQGGDSTPLPGDDGTTHPTTGNPLVTKPGVYNPPPINTSLPSGAGWVWAKHGDTAASIAKKYNTTVGLLQAYNTPATLNSFGNGKWVRVRGRAGAMPK